MTRTDLFLFALQTYCARSDRVNNIDLARILDAASQLPVEALGDQPAAAAALDYFEWQLASKGDPKRLREPKWLADFQRVVSDVVCVRVNADVAATTWWMHAERAAEDSLAGQGPIFPDVCRPLIMGRDTVLVVRSQDAAIFRQWVESIAGCEEQPFLFEKVKS